MIRECNTHGYFSDDDLCPACNSEGKFIMRGNERDTIARRLALVLRHAPEKFDLEMDINGWIDVKDIVFQFKKSNERRFHWLFNRTKAYRDGNGSAGSKKRRAAIRRRLLPSRPRSSPRRPVSRLLRALQ